MLTALWANFDKWDVYVIVATALIVFLVMRFRGAQGWNFDHFWQNLDKFLLVFLFLLACLLLLHAIHHAADGGVISWVQNTAGQILSALLAVLGGAGVRALTRKNDGGNGNGNGQSVVPTVTQSLVATGAVSGDQAG